MQSLVQDIFIPIGYFFDIVGALIATWAGIIAIEKFLVKEFQNVRNKKKHVNLEALRLDLSHKMVLAIEFFLVGDIIKTVTTPTLEAILILAALVLIRTTLNYFLRKDLQVA